MISAKIVERPARFDRVDRVKEAVGQRVLPEDDRFWILGGCLVAQVGVREWIEVPVGFTTDGASVPRWAQDLTGWAPWADPQRWAGIVHDWLYSRRGVAKSQADNVFRAVLVPKEPAGGNGSSCTSRSSWAAGRLIEPIRPEARASSSERPVVRSELSTRSTNARCGERTSRRRSAMGCGEPTASPATPARCTARGDSRRLSSPAGWRSGTRTKTACARRSLAVALPM